MKRISSLGILFLCFVALQSIPLGGDSVSAAANLPAFPGAQGYGSTTSGGRGGRVIEVTNLNDEGPGSFREACAASGARIIVFRTGGTIRALSDIEVRNPYVTIAGQTAPGDGICIRGAALRIPTHDVIVRSLRIRVGDDANGPDLMNRDGIGIDNSSTPPYNIIIDHCSVSWSGDENFATWWPCHDITFQWCITSESLLQPDDESYGMLIGDEATNVSVHHCLIANNKDRSPLVGFVKANIEVVNNLVYNWRWYGSRMYAGANLIANHYKPGPNWTGGLGIAPEDVSGLSIYVKDNIGPGREANTGDDWLIVSGSDGHRSATVLGQLSGMKIDKVEDVYELVLNNAGALAPSRDAVDLRIVQSVRAGTGAHIKTQDQVGGWPTYSAGQAPADTDHDGMPDAWETSHGLNPSDATDGNKDADGDGYTNVEQYLNGLIPVAGTAVAAPKNLRPVQ
jgi:pectate lyase